MLKIFHYRNLLGCSLAVLLLSCAEANYRQRRQSPDSTFYQPPLLLNNAPQPQPQQNSYQPPISRPSNNGFEYRSPLEYSSSGHQSVQYVPHDTSQSFSVHQQQPSSSIGSSERTSKVVGSSSSVQAIHKAPASEIEAKKESLAKEKDAAKDEYVVYYYYYYDNDTAANNLSSSNFDDIPSLESFDDAKEPERIQTNLGNSVDDSRNLSSQARSAASQASDAFIRADRQPQPLKPVSNVFRYGSNEVPRFPVLPNFVVSEVSTTTTTEGPTPLLTSETPTTMSSPDVEEDDAVNSVLDNTTDLKEAKSQEVEETTTTTTTEPPTTTEEDTTTTTERPTRRRPSIGGSRRRFNPNPSSATSPNRGRNPPSRSSTSSSSTSTTTTVAPTRRSFQGSNRVRSRQPSSRTRTTSDSEDRPPSRSTTESTTTSSTTARSRFTSAAPRRFQSNRSRSQTSSSTTSTSTTTRSPSASSPSRSRPTSRPRPNLISRNRPPRPGFLRPRPEDTVAETTTATPAEAEETTPANEAASTAEEGDSEEETSEEEEEEEESEEQATTTESNRFSALFRPRNRNALNRPRPAIGNRPSRS